MSKDSKPSPVEVLKEESHFLRGEIPEELAQDTDHFGKGSEQLLKHHGTYQQDDRDERAAARAAGSGKSYMMMIRTRVPGGRMTSQQLLAELDLCDQFGNGTLRITTRQALQLHGILKSDLRETIARINEVKLTTLGACGDVNRNVMCCPAPLHDGCRQQLQRLADAIAEHLAPRTAAYRQIWMKDLVTDEKSLVSGTADGFDVEPIYGKHYLPRKFKVGIALPEDNCIDVYTHDVGLVAQPRGDTIESYCVLVGGGFGVTPSATKTFPAVGQHLGVVDPDEVLDVVTAIVGVQRDFGNRSDRKIARLKYLIADWGIDAFREKVAEYLGRPLNVGQPPRITSFCDHLGWTDQGDGRWCYGLNVENGRIRDGADMQLKSALREIGTTLAPNIRLTSHQSILFADVESDERAALEEILQKHKVPLSEQISTVRRWSMACVAWPTCGLSITEAERALPGLVDRLEVELQKLGLDQQEFTLRMTGCPNGCARPYNADVGIVGKAKDKYTLFLGGHKLGTRLNYIYKDLVPADEVVNELVAVLQCFKQARLNGETLGDFCHRWGKDELLARTAAASTAD